MWSVFREASTYLYFALYFSRFLSCKNLNVAGDLFRERNGGKEREREGGRERERGRGRERGREGGRKRERERGKEKEREGERNGGKKEGGREGGREKLVRFQSGVVGRWEFTTRAQGRILRGFHKYSLCDLTSSCDRVSYYAN